MLQKKKSLIQFKPDYAPAHSSRGIAHLAKGDIDKSLTDFGDAIRLDPADTVALANRGNTYAANSQFERAIADFNSAIRLKPYSSWPYINRGRAELHLGQTPAAISDLGTAVRLSPTNAYAVIWLHLAHLQATEDDSQQFRRDAANVDRNKWPGPIVDLFLGMAGPETVSTAAQVYLSSRLQSERTCEVSFYLGTFELQHGNRLDAKSRFDAATANCPRYLIELAAAKAALEQIDSNP